MIELKNVTKSYNGEQVLRGVSLTVSDGEFLSVMGESGSGKSTLLNVLGGFLPPDSGEVLWKGEDITRHSPEKAAYFRCHTLGFVFQSFRLISTLTAEENVFLPALLAKQKPSETRRLAELYSEKLGLGGMMKKYPNQLSGGQQQRVAIVRALVYRPLAIVLDEPTGALDSAMQRRVMELLRELNQAEGATIVQVTHNREMAQYGGRIVRLKDGILCG